MAAEPNPLTSLAAALRALVRWFRATRIPGMVIGGVANAFLGRPRMTRDVDALICLAEEHWEQFVANGRRFDIVPRIHDVIAFARESRMLLMRHRPSGIDVDITLGAIPFEKEALMRRTSGTLGRSRIPIPTPEDFIIMKAVAHRPHDIADIRGVLVAHPKLDVGRIRNWTRRFATALDAPELADDLGLLLGEHQPRRTKRKRS
jgi:hypothetical protein